MQGISPDVEAAEAVEDRATWPEQKAAMNIIGLDLSITATGIAYSTGATRTIKGPASAGDKRLLQIVNHLTYIHGESPINLAVIEDIPTHAHAAGVTAMVHGAVRVMLMRENIPYVLVTPATLKAFATGKGNANKTDMAVAALKRAGREFADDNQCDAWWLRQAALHRYGTPEFPLPAAQVARLDKVAWPQPLEVVL